MPGVDAAETAMVDRSVRGLSLAALAVLLGLPVQAQTQRSNPALLENRRSQIRQWIEQQQAGLRHQLECTSTARSLDELDRCQGGLPRMGPGMHGGWGTGGWGCPPW